MDQSLSFQLTVFSGLILKETETEGSDLTSKHVGISLLMY